jgi:hypothetical protein
MSAEKLLCSLLSAHHALLSFPILGASYKTRRIIDEWGTTVKRKISLSFKEIIDIARSTEDGGSELRIGVFQVPTHGGFVRDWTGDVH